MAMLLNASALNVACLNGATGSLKSLASASGCNASAQAQLGIEKRSQSDIAGVGHVIGLASIQKTIEVVAIAFEQSVAWIALGFQLGGLGLIRAHSLAGALQVSALHGLIRGESNAEASITVAFAAYAETRCESYASAHLTGWLNLQGLGVIGVRTHAAHAVAYAVSSNTVISAETTGFVTLAKVLDAGSLSISKAQASATLVLLMGAEASTEGEMIGRSTTVKTLTATPACGTLASGATVKIANGEAEGVCQVSASALLGGRVIVQAQMQGASFAYGQLVQGCFLTGAVAVQAAVSANGGVLYCLDARVDLHPTASGSLDRYCLLSASLSTLGVSWGLASMHVPLQVLASVANADLSAAASMVKGCGAQALCQAQLDAQAVALKTIHARGDAVALVLGEAYIAKHSASEANAMVQSFASCDLTKALVIVTAVATAQPKAHSTLTKSLAVAGFAQLGANAHLDTLRPLAGAGALAIAQTFGFASLYKLLGSVAAQAQVNVEGDGRLVKPILAQALTTSLVTADGSLTKPLALDAQSAVFSQSAAALGKTLSLAMTAASLPSASAILEKPLALGVHAIATVSTKSLDVTKHLALQAVSMLSTSSDAELHKPIDASAQAVARSTGAADCIKTVLAQGECVGITAAMLDLRIPLSGWARLQQDALATCSMIKRLDGAGDTPIVINPSLNLLLQLDGRLIHVALDDTVSIFITKTLNGFDLAISMIESAHLKRLYQHKHIRASAQSLAPRVSISPVVSVA